MNLYRRHIRCGINAMFFMALATGGGQSIASNSHTENGSVPGVEEAPAATPGAATLVAFMAVFLAPASHVGMHSISDTVPGSIL